MTILEVLVRLRDDLKLWVTNNLRTKASISDVESLSSSVSDLTARLDALLPAEEATFGNV